MNQSKNRKQKVESRNAPTGGRTLLLFLLSAFSISAFSADLQVCTSDLTTRILPGRLVTLTPASTPAHPPGWLTLMTPWTGFTGTNGCVTVTNLLGGAYRLTISGTPITSLLLEVPTNVVLVNAWFCLTNATLPASNAPAAYSTQAADALFATKTLLTNLINDIGGPTNGVTWLQASNAARDIALALDYALSNVLAAAASSNASYQSSLSYSIGANDTNFALAASNTLAFVSSSNASYQSSLAYSLGANATNFTMAVSNTLASAGGGAWALIATNALTAKLASNAILGNLAAGAALTNASAFQPAGSYVPNDYTWGVAYDASSTADGIARMVFSALPGIQSGLNAGPDATNQALLYLEANPNYLTDTWDLMLASARGTVADVNWLHDNQPAITLNGVATNGAQTITGLKTIIMPDRVVITGAGTTGDNGLYVASGSGFQKDANHQIVTNSAGAMLLDYTDGYYTNAGRTMATWTIVSGAAPAPSGRYGTLTLDADPPGTNSPVRWSDIGPLIAAAPGDAGGTNARAYSLNGSLTNPVLYAATIYGSTAGTNKTFTDTNGWWNTNTAGGFVNIKRGKVIAGLGTTLNSFTPNAGTTSHPRSVFEVGNSTADSSVGLAVHPNYSTTPGKRVIMYVCTRQNETGAAAQLGMQITEGGFGQFYTAVNQGDSYGSPPLQFLVDYGTVVFTARTNGTMPEVDMNGCLIVTNHIRAGTNLTLMTGLADPTVTGTNNGIMWASNNTLFWTWTAGGTTTNTAKIVGP